VGRHFIGCCTSGEEPPVGVRIRDAKLGFNVLLSEEHLDPDCHFAFLNVPWSEGQSEK
jgi:hypothetical protein